MWLTAKETPTICVMSLSYHRNVSLTTEPNLKMADLQPHFLTKKGLEAFTGNKKKIDFSKKKNNNNKKIFLAALQCCPTEVPCFHMKINWR